MGNALSCFKKNRGATTTSAGPAAGAGKPSTTSGTKGKVAAKAEGVKGKIEAVGKDTKAKVESAGKTAEAKVEGVKETAKAKTGVGKTDTGDEIGPTGGTAAATGATTATAAKGKSSSASSSSSSASSSKSSLSGEDTKTGTTDEKDSKKAALAVPAVAGGAVAADKAVGSREVELEQGNVELEPDDLIRVDDGPISGTLSPARPPTGKVYIPAKSSLEAAPVTQFWDVEIEGMEHQMPSDAEHSDEDTHRTVPAEEDLSHEEDDDDAVVVMREDDIGDVTDEFEDARDGREGPEEHDRDISEIAGAAVPAVALSSATPVDKSTEDESNVRNLKAKFEQAKDEMPQAKALQKDIRDPVTGEMVTIEEFKRRRRARGIVDENVKKYEEISDEAAKEKAELDAQKEALERARRDSSAASEKNAGSPTTLAADESERRESPVSETADMGMLGSGSGVTMEDPVIDIRSAPDTSSPVSPAQEAVDSLGDSKSTTEREMPPAVGAFGGVAPTSPVSGTTRDSPKYEDMQGDIDVQDDALQPKTVGNESGMTPQDRDYSTAETPLQDVPVAKGAGGPGDSTDILEDEGLLMTGGTGIPPATEHPLKMSDKDTTTPGDSGALPQQESPAYAESPMAETVPETNLGRTSSADKDSAPAAREIPDPDEDVQNTSVVPDSPSANNTGTTSALSSGPVAEPVPTPAPVSKSPAKEAKALDTSEEMATEGARRESETKGGLLKSLHRRISSREEVGRTSKVKELAKRFSFKSSS